MSPEKLGVRFGTEATIRGVWSYQEERGRESSVRKSRQGTHSNLREWSTGNVLRPVCGGTGRAVVGRLESESLWGTFQRLLRGSGVSGTSGWGINNKRCDIVKTVKDQTGGRWRVHSRDPPVPDPDRTSGDTKTTGRDTDRVSRVRHKRLTASCVL